MHLCCTGLNSLVCFLVTDIVLGTCDNLNFSCLFLPVAYEVCEGYRFTRICLSGRGVPGQVPPRQVPLGPLDRYTPMDRYTPWAGTGRQVPIFSYFFLFFSAYSYFSYFLAISSYFSYFLAILLTISKYLLGI